VFTVLPSIVGLGVIMLSVFMPKVVAPKDLTEKCGASKNDFWTKRI